MAAPPRSSPRPGGRFAYDLGAGVKKTGHVAGGRRLALESLRRHLAPEAQRA